MMHDYDDYYSSAPTLMHDYDDYVRLSQHKMSLVVSVG